MRNEKRFRLSALHALGALAVAVGGHAFMDKLSKCAYPIFSGYWWYRTALLFLAYFAGLVVVMWCDSRS